MECPKFHSLTLQSILFIISQINIQECMSGVMDGQVIETQFFLKNTIQLKIVSLLI